MFCIILDACSDHFDVNFCAKAFASTLMKRQQINTEKICLIDLNCISCFYLDCQLYREPCCQKRTLEGRVFRLPQRVFTLLNAHRNHSCQEGLFRVPRNSQHTTVNGICPCPLPSALLGSLWRNGLGGSQLEALATVGQVGFQTFLAIE